MYELWIKNSAGNYMLADLGEDIPAMTYQTNDIAELENRQANYSLSFSLPKTANNCQILGFADIPDVVTDFPYRKHDCRLYSNNYAIAGEGSYLTLNKVSDLYFDCQILSGIASFFNLLKDKSMEDLNLGYIIRGKDNFFENIRNETYTIPAAIYEKNIAHTLDNARSRNFFPAVFVKKTMEEICKESGYELKNNLEGTAWNDLAVSLCDLKPRQEDIDIYEVEYSNYVTNSSILELVYPGFVRGAEAGLDLVKLEPSEGMNLLKYNAKFTGKFRCKFDLNITYSSPENESEIRIEFKNLSTNSILYEYKKDIFPGTTGRLNFDTTINMTAGDIIQMKLDRAVNNRYIYDVFSFSFDELKGEEVGLGSNLYLSQNLGFKTQFDYFKAICQALGLTVNVNEGNKIVELYSTEKLYTNKYYAKDWTKKCIQEMLNKTLLFVITRMKIIFYYRRIQMMILQTGECLW